MTLFFRDSELRMACVFAQTRSIIERYHKNIEKLDLDTIADIIDAIGSITLNSNPAIYAKGGTKIIYYLEDHGPGELFNVEYPTIIEAIEATNKAGIFSVKFVATLLWNNMTKEQKVATNPVVARTIARGTLVFPEVAMEPYPKN